MFVPAHAFDIVLAVGLVTEKALVNFGMLLTRHSHREHIEMHHIMAGRRLITLRAIALEPRIYG